MIAGLGMDIVKIRRVETLFEKHGEIFLQKILADDELALLPEKNRFSPEKIAGKWAAKEAVVKALGCGFGSLCAITDIHILHNEAGAPLAHLTGCGKIYAEKLGIDHIFLSITHEKEYAAAVAVLEKKA